MRQLIILAALPVLMACADAESPVEADVVDPSTAVAGEVEKSEMADMGPGVDLTTLPAGAYSAEMGHAYIQFSYDHQGYSRPILRWSDFDATVNYDPETPENSTLNVVIPVVSIDSNVDAFNTHLKSADFFDVETYPTITFASTNVEIHPGGHGIVTGNLTIKDVTRPISFEGTINKIGKSRSGTDMFGLSGTGKLKRSDFGVDLYAPLVGDDVDLVMEVEFQKDE